MHEKTDEMVWREPTLDQFLPSGWKQPNVPLFFTEKQTGYLITPRIVRKSGLDTPDSAKFNCDTSSTEVRSVPPKTTPLLGISSDQSRTDKEALKAASRLLIRKKQLLESGKKNTEVLSVKSKT